MKKAWLAVLTLLILSFALGFTLLSVKKQRDEPKTTIGDSLRVGVSFSPKSFGQEDFLNFFTTAREVGNTITWAGDWQELAKTENSAPVTITELSQKYGYTPIIIVQFFTQDSGELLRPLTSETTQKYIESLEAYAQEYQPKYLGIGIEVNILYAESPEQFSEFVALYTNASEAVKSVSPETHIFPIFQLEKMKGLNGGLFGGQNNPDAAQWHLIGKFPMADLIAFTTYPGIIYTDPSDIPADYYEEIVRYTSKPIAFTEIGWHSIASPKGYESSESEQAVFIERFFTLTQKLRLDIAIWLFLYDQDIKTPFNSMGLHRKTGEPKPALNAWKNR